MNNIAFGKHTVEPHFKWGDEAERAKLKALAPSGPAQWEGLQWRFTFANGHGASVINDGYGEKAGLYEVMPLGVRPDDWDDSVKGWLTTDEVGGLLDWIEAQP